MLFLLSGLKTYLVDYLFVIILYLIIGGLFDLVKVFFLLVQAGESYGNITLTKEVLDDVLFEEDNDHQSDRDLHHEETDQGPLCLHDKRLYTLYEVIPALVAITMFSFLSKRKKLRRDCFQGRPGLVIPVDLLGDQNRFAYMILFGAWSVAFFDLFRGTSYVDLSHVSDSMWFGALSTTLNVAFIGLLAYPIFTAIGCRHKIVGSLIGLCYAVVYFILNGLQPYFCGYMVVDIGPVTDAGQIIFFLPTMIMWALVCIRLVYVLIVASIRRFRKSREIRKLDLDSVADFIYVRNLLKKDKQESTASKGILGLLRCCLHWVYKPVPGFTYSTRVLVTIAITSSAMIQVGVYEVFSLRSAIHDFHLDAGEHHVLLERSGYGDIGLLWFHSVSSINGIMYCTLTMVLVVIAIFIFKILDNYRKDLLSMFRGEKHFLPAGGSPCCAMVSCLKFTGFQIGFLLWGFIVLQLTFALLFFLICFQIVVPLQHGIESNFFSQFGLMWYIYNSTLFSLAIVGHAIETYVAVILKSPGRMFLNCLLILFVLEICIHYVGCLVC
ncbi:stimulated by retinoic acid gene 6 protein-like [Ptychodera flava]|uniref:stimulated by retinoic acid gene 6 protein-like n=1 Tax=Ptychodera flava TaxID=63121 RepID=UPI00396AA62E